MNAAHEINLCTQLKLKIRCVEEELDCLLGEFEQNPQLLQKWSMPAQVSGHQIRSRSLSHWGIFFLFFLLLLLEASLQTVPALSSIDTDQHAWGCRRVPDMVTY